MVEKKIMKIERLTSLFFTFVMGTISLMTAAIFASFGLETRGLIFSLVLTALVLVFIWSYLGVLVSFFLYYFTKNKTKLLAHFEKNKKKYVVSLFIGGIIIYMITIYILEKNLIKVLNKGLEVALLVIGGYILNWLIKEKPNKTTK